MRSDAPQLLAFVRGALKTSGIQAVATPWESPYALPGDVKVTKWLRREEGAARAYFVLDGDTVRGLLRSGEAGAAEMVRLLRRERDGLKHRVR